MHDIGRARYVELKRSDGQFTIVLYDENRQEIGHGYRGPTVRRAEADLKYWKRDKGLQEIAE
jgi:hypothetical protein